MITRIISPKHINSNNQFKNNNKKSPLKLFNSLITFVSKPLNSWMTTKTNQSHSNKKLPAWFQSTKKILQAQMQSLYKKSSPSLNNINKVWNKPTINTLILHKNSKSNNNKGIISCSKLKIVSINYKGWKLKSKLKS